jgi:hypothetical protein
MARNTATTGVNGSWKKITMDGDFPEVKPMDSNEKESGYTAGTISIQEFIISRKRLVAKDTNRPKLKNKKVGLISLNENLDTSTPTGKLMVTMMGAIAEFERNNLLERQREGIAIAKEDGRYKGRKR